MLLIMLIMAAGGPALAKAEAAGATQKPGTAASEWVAPDQEKAKKRAKEIVPFVEGVFDECKLCRQQRLRDLGLSVKDQVHSYMLLDSPIIKKTEDRYGPVRFMHSRHAVLTQDCAVCHHVRPAAQNATETGRCSACHQEAFRTDHPERLGLKAAYHQQCMNCHVEKNKGPTNCTGCHQKNVPDHRELVRLPEKPEPSQVTGECLRCHQEAGKDMLTTAHWLWKGPSPFTLQHRLDIQIGKATTAVNNF